ncbi:biofilm formation regulator HmsP [Acerihabitans arboris]|uniref:Biofilm formation regulator HmsP n=1 Tax=Acerihabitans arboris TaxID=2691583 RepID=A0A845SNV4_9GAMM|nr:biofilm formation regulator HmsP [Acerihabitans arboris]NDL64626.1 biofilm formation regulator HmsP [Acerihabitans arboris]
MRIRRSLTIKQMATVSGVALVTICIFIVIQLFHFVQQRREDYAQQLQNIAMSVRLPLSSAVLKGDVPQAERILNTLKPVGILSRADVVLPDDFQVLHADFPPERPVPALIARLFRLPVEISVPLYALPRPSHPRALASLVLQADSYRLYQFIASAFSTMMSTYLLLALVLTVSITWCINRLMVHPLREIARELEMLSPQDAPRHQLSLPDMHRDDELGVLVRSYNRNQQVLAGMLEDLNRLSTRHAETALPNKNLFTAMLDSRMALRKDPQQYCLLVISIGTLQEASGVLTEAQRGILLMTLTRQLKRHLNDHRFLGQLNHNEFAVFDHCIQNAFEGMQLAQGILKSINAPLTIGSLSLRPAASIGIALRQRSEESAHQLLRRATSAMMLAHDNGKNQILFFEPKLTAMVHRRMTLESTILEGIEQERCALFFQPQVDIRNRQLIGAEVLLRWRQDDGSYSLPSDFISGAEEIGAMVPLGNWVLEASCRVLAQWRERGAQLQLAVNLSAKQLQESNLVPFLKVLLARYQIGPAQLVLEITETARITEFEHSLDLLRQLRELGILIALDDFGMGYSSLYYLDRLRKLPIDLLKIDRSFIEKLPEDLVMLRIVSAIAEVLSLPVIAEGVETQAQLQCLLQHKINWGQGYLFSEPLPQGDFEQRFLHLAAV